MPTAFVITGRLHGADDDNTDVIITDTLANAKAEFAKDQRSFSGLEFDEDDEMTHVYITNAITLGEVEDGKVTLDIERHASMSNGI